MRPETAYQIVNKSMAKFYKIPTVEDVPVILNKIRTPKFNRALQKCLQVQIKDLKLLCEQSNKNRHPSIEKYVYYPSSIYYYDTIDDLESVCFNLFYISDRWNCEGRIKFFQEVLKRY
jgi:hypothetical protein